MTGEDVINYALGFGILVSFCLLVDSWFDLKEATRREQESSDATVRHMRDGH